MSDKKYIIKNLAPWMLDELLALSKQSNFNIIFLRQQDKFYDEGLKKLKDNGIKIYIKPYSFDQFPKKLFVVIKFFFSNLLKFRFDYNFIIGIKSIYWFLRMDINLFNEESKIHAQFATQAALLSLITKKYFDNKPRYSFTFHAYDIYFKNHWLQMLIENSYRSFSISEYNIEYLKENYNITSNKLKLSRLGVFRDNNGKREYKVGSKTFVLGLMSWFTQKKGIHYLMQAILELKKKGSDVKLKLAGDGPLKSEFLEFIEKNHLTNMINYVGKVKGEEKQKFYNSINAFVLPSISLKNDQDGIPVVLMEAIAYGLPIISTEVSGIPEICIDNYNGFLIKEKDVDSIVDSVVNLCENKDKIELFSKNSLILSKDYDIQLNSMKKVKNLNW